ncbi:MAG TPA: hypothetical protein PKW55_05485 [Spirochaetota bacterium]|nr:hypothetical protein [Spirochaetota bacterium]HOM37595.1 hypothetical protein [Spirochaetota bacterium]HPQ49434.1 hypothetical protein [Spirochaetota bacterium]
MLKLDRTALLIQGMAGFETLLLGFFKAFQENNIMFKAISTEGASIKAAMIYSANYPIEKALKEIKNANLFATPPEAVFTNSYFNSTFHSTSYFSYYNDILTNNYSTPFSYHYKITEETILIQKNMKIPVYTSIVNLLTGEHKTINLQEFDLEKKHLWLGTRIPYFKPVKIDGEIFIEDHFNNPPVNILLDKYNEIEKFIIVRSYPKMSKPPSSLLELNDRANDIAMNSYLDQQLYFIEKVNKWVKEGLLPKEKYRNIQIFSLNIDPEPLEYLDYRPSQLQKKFDIGYKKGTELLRELNK